MTLHHEEWGSGRPVLFVHAWSLTSAMWTYQISDLSRRGLRCIAFDRRGHGRSEVPGDGYGLDRLADDIAEVIAQLDLNDVALVGMSMGCNEILNYIARHGTARIARIAMLGPTTPFPLQTADNALGAPRAYFEQCWAAWQSDFPKWIEDNKLPFFTKDTSPQMMDWVAGMMRQMPIQVAVATNRALIATDLRPVLPKIDRPVLILHGDSDVSAPLDTTGRPTAKGIKGAELKVYPGGPHGLFVTHMAQINADLAAFAS
ncbi:Arylesterase (Aryl-ester hydrolase) [Bradyrhizobium sp. ORS 278]|nr:Arylesterase (Aryl-ester hydrolase) [Bradyrhizobium sp. ORS 278]